MKITNNNNKNQKKELKIEGIKYMKKMPHG